MADRQFEIFIKLIKIAIIYKLYKIYSVESLKMCDFLTHIKMMSILIQQRMPVIMLFFGIMKSY